MRKALIGAAMWVSWGVACADSLIDLSLVLPPAPEKHVLIRPAVSWEVRPDAATHCEQVKDHDGFAVWQEGCVHWTRSKPGCTIVTTQRTTHSVMGRLFLLCLQAGNPS
jgi:hypothetical protein